MSNYDRGAAAERKARRALEAAGFLVIRSAGSHGPFDLVAINEREVRLIQVKANEAPLTVYERAHMKSLAHRLSRLCRVELWTYVKGGGLRVTPFEVSA